MKALVRDYLASLRERDELDAVLPELLSELGYRVFSRPGRGTQQLGVDVAAVGKVDGEDKVFLFSVKPGDLTRKDWMNDTPQALKYSLDEAKQVYLRNRLPAQYRKLKVVICIVIGGEVHEHMREHLRAYFEANETDRISYDEWDGDRLAELVLQGLLREEILPDDLRGSFRKSIVMVDEPDVSMRHFNHLVQSLIRMDDTPKARVRVARQLNICAWILFVWTRSTGNVEAPYRASEITLLATWELVRRSLDGKSKPDKKLITVLRHTLNLHLSVARAYLAKIMPHTGVMHGLSSAVGSRSALDVNLALFDVLGRIALWGLWMYWAQHAQPQDAAAFRLEFDKAVTAGKELLRNNPALLLPAVDHQTTDISLFLQLWVAERMDLSPVRAWLEEMTGRLVYAVKTRTRYPSCSTDYVELNDQLANQKDDEHFKEATAGSTLIPVMAAWLQALGESGAYNALAKLMDDELDHCTLQLWMPDATSEPALYLGGNNPHGRALAGLSLKSGGNALLKVIAEASNRTDEFDRLSPLVFDFWPILFVACRHHRLPIPSKLWIFPLLPPEQPQVRAMQSPAAGARLGPTTAKKAAKAKPLAKPKPKKSAPKKARAKSPPGRRGTSR